MMNRRHRVEIPVIGSALSLALLIPMPRVAAAAASSPSMNPARVQALLDQLADDSDEEGRGREELLAWGPAVIPYVLEHQQDPRPSMRYWVVELLSQLDEQEDQRLNRDDVIAALVAILTDAQRRWEIHLQQEPAAAEPELRYDEESVIVAVLGALQTLDPAKATPSLIDTLLVQVHRGQARAAFILGRVGTPAIRPALEPYAQHRDHEFADAVQQALAKLGDARYVAAFIAQLDVAGPQRNEAFKKLGYIGNPQAVRRIAAFLDDTSAPPPEVGPRDRVTHLPYQQAAAWALAQIVQDPPVKKVQTILTAEELALWRAWWQAHQHEYP